MRDKVIPLLQEYFFEDWSRIAAVVGPGFIHRRVLRAPPGLGDLPNRATWSVLQRFAPAAYNDLIGGVAVSEPNDEDGEAVA
jgi:5-methylcytosine-specific restriction protein B